ncbi:Actin-like protein arp6 [Cladophialophora carrionii]|uniref:Actin-like protein arp6 n=1 Tax=Cladophialophora carrionii TaxID=86049 RepID=A0A1C1CFZ0_9EURO|nr:Actin-like protein arp6 [Cladophialophora carrionii]
MPRATKSTRHTPGLPSSTFVLDNGAYNIKAGFAPAGPASDAAALQKCHAIPNCIVRTRDKKTYIGAQSQEITQWSEALFRRPVENGQVVSWETQKDIWDESFFDDKTARNELLVKHPEETTLLFTEPPNTMPELQKNADEIIVEEWGFGGYARVIGRYGPRLRPAPPPLRAKREAGDGWADDIWQGPSLNAYNDLHPLFEGESYTKSEKGNNDSAFTDLPMECVLVIDSGYSHSTVTPLFNGRPIHRAIRRLDFGGKHLTNLLKELISVRHFDLHQDTKIVNDIKEEVCFVSDDFRRDLERTWKGNKGHRQQVFASNTQRSDHAMDLDHPASQQQDEELRVDYILPDGIRLLRGFSRPHDSSTSAQKRRKAAALASDPEAEIAMTLGNERFSVPEILFSPSDIGSKQPGLPDIVMQSLGVLPPLVQATMLSNVLVVGGSAKIAGLVERLEAELRMRVKTEWAVRVRKMPDPTTSTWLGGARLASNWPEVVREYGVTKEEYYEHGSAWVARRFVSGGSGKGP